MDTPANDTNRQNQKDYIINFVCACLVVIITVSIICYFTYGIIILISDYNLWVCCNSESALWPYCLISIILSINKSNARFISKENIYNYEKKSVVYLVMMWSIELTLCSWGAVELFLKASKCDDLENSELWIYGVVTFTHQLLFILFTFMFVIKICRLISLDINEEINNNSRHISTV